MGLREIMNKRRNVAKSQLDGVQCCAIGLLGAVELRQTQHDRGQGEEV
jgi:hypothetical protein